MKTYARIERDTIQELFTTDSNIKELFHPSMHWVDVTGLTPKPSEDWRYISGKLYEPIIPMPLF